MSRMNGAARGQYDELGFESPFAETHESGMRSDSEATLGEMTEATFPETPFAETLSEEAGFDESGSESGLDESDLGETGSWSEEEQPLSEDETFPSGLVLQPASGATGKNEEHWDPHQTGHLLLATGPDVQGQKVSPHFTVKELVTSGG